MKRKFILLLLVVLVMVMVFVVGHQLLQQGGPGNGGSGTPTATVSFPTTMLHAQGSHLVDASGHPLLLRGAQIESPFNYVKGWQSGKKPTAILNSRVFAIMVRDWKMNTLRLPISNWIYAKDSANYMSQLDQVVREANAAGLYVVLDLHDDYKSGSPYGKAVDFPKAESVVFWKTVAAHYKDNSMVMFDVFNEPKVRGWQTWLHGGAKVNGVTVIGMQDLVDAIRSVGAYQSIIVEAGAAGGGTTAAGGWATIGTYTISDPNIVYSLHVYDGIVLSAQQQDAKWGPILNHYPIYYGEWALLPNSNIPAQCRDVAAAQAGQTVEDFLSYMDSRQANWTAWEFAPHYLIRDYTNFTPTSLEGSWTCGDTQSEAGMGVLVKQFLTSHPSS